MKNPELIEQAKNGDAKAVSQLYQDNVREVYRFIYYKVGNREDAEDLTQDVLIAAFAGLKNFRGDAKFRNWCYEIAKRKIADLWREKYKMPTMDIEAVLGLHTAPETEQELTERENHKEFKEKQIASFLKQLKDNYRTVLEYRFLKNYTIKETAAAMNISISNTKVLQHRALKKAATLGEMPILNKEND